MTDEQKRGFSKMAGLNAHTSMNTSISIPKPVSSIPTNKFPYMDIQLCDDKQSKIFAYVIYKLLLANGYTVKLDPESMVSVKSTYTVSNIQSELELIKQKTICIK